MSLSPQPQNVQLKKLFDEPALYITTQTTVPLLTTVMLTFSAVLIAIAALNLTKLSVLLPLIHVSLSDAALTSLSIAALLFVFTTEGCVKSQGWDYFAVSQERRDFENLEDAPAYKEYCLRRSKLWHTLAAWAFNYGTFFQLLGVMFLVWPFASFVSIIIVVYLVLHLLADILVIISPRNARRLTNKIAVSIESIVERIHRR
jgi:hypothetical protein